jgi:Na+/H+ antiporter NhaD/arsenite permease-like protein
VIFAIAVVLLITHAQSGLTVAFIGVFVAALMLIVQHKNALALLKKVDYKTLLFFIGLFIVVGGLEETGVLVLIADGISYVCGSNQMLVVAVILWVSGVASAFVDNIPFAATMIPVIQSLSELQGISLPVLAWTLSMGTDIGGSATPIGASANVVGISVASREGYPIGWGKYCRYSAPATIMVLLISMVCIYVRYF